MFLRLGLLLTLLLSLLLVLLLFLRCVLLFCLLVRRLLATAAAATTTTGSRGAATALLLSVLAALTWAFSRLLCSWRGALFSGSACTAAAGLFGRFGDRKSTRLNSSHVANSYA